MSTRRRTRLIEPEPSPPRTRPSRSPARSRKVSPARKSPPAREIAPKPKSPSRKSPSRKVTSKYPARKSPARTGVVKEVDPIIEELQLTVPRSPSKRPALQSDTSVRLENISSTYRATRSKRIEYSVKDIFGVKERTPEKNGITEFGLSNRSSADDASYTPRRSSRLRDFIDVVPSLPDIRRSVSKSISKPSRTPSESVSKSLDAYSDEENSADESLKGKKSYTHSARKLSTPLRSSISKIATVSRHYEFGGRIGTAALILLIPLSVISILTACLKSCSIETLLKFTPFKSSALWFSVPSSSFILANIVIQAIIAVFPFFGPKADSRDNTGRKQCFNAFFSGVLVTQLIYGLDYLEIINKDIILLEYLKLATASYIFAVLLSIALYAKSRKLEKQDVNEYGNTGYLLYDFFLGREIHPSFKKINIKIWISRICNINTLILLLLICSRAIKIQLTPPEADASVSPLQILSNIQLQISNYTLLLFSIIQIVYILNFIVKEYRVTSTFYWQSEGVGYLQTVSSSLYPFYFTSISKHISDTGLTLSTNVLAIALLLFLLGYGLMLLSNDIKYEFRRDPLQPGLANLESMMTFNGKRLMTSHLWGVLRHPNYAGDIIIHSVLALPGLLSGQVAASSPALITVLVLLHRAWRDDSRCKRRYGSAWTRYCKKVPSVIIPKVL